MLLWLAVRPGAASGRDLARTRGVSIEPLLAAAVRRDNPDLVAFFSARPELLLMRLKYKGELDIVSAVLGGCQTIWQREPQRWKRLRKMFGLEDD
jgi:cytidylate kinase